MIASPPDSARRAELRARELLRLSEDTQMERASLGAWKVFREIFPEGREFTVLCGPGANGGDGLALARHAFLDGFCPKVCFPGKLPAEGTLSHLQLARLLALGLAILSWDELYSTSGALPAVDALFGTGLSRPLAAPYDAAAVWLSARPTLSLDLPSGLDGRTGHPLGAVVRAAVTVTFGRPKTGLLLDPGRDVTGVLHVVDIGIPEVCWEGEESLAVLEENWARGCLPVRARGAHKGAAGKAVLLVGSSEYFGAAVLASSAALRSGAGLLVVASTQEVAGKISLAVPEVIGRVAIGPEAGNFGQILSGARAVLAGPGLGRSAAAEEALTRLLELWQGPLVLDADALNLVSERQPLRELLAVRSGALVLTPHPAEAARLLGTSVSELLADPVAAARCLSEGFAAVVVFKTATPVIAAPDGRHAVGVAGHFGMATGGSGDALAGTLVARLAEGEESFAATCQAVRAHARAGDLAGKTGRRGMSVTDLVTALPQAWEEMEP